MKSFLQLIRWPNLLIIVLTQYLMRWSILKPILSSNGFELQFSEFHFALLVLATVFITAAGYVINDYFDTRTDRVNRPETVIVGKTINRRLAILLHIVLNTIGIGLGIYISFVVGMPVLSLVFVTITGILWFYSASYKRQLLIGNIIVAVLTAMVPLMVALFEIPMLNEVYGAIMKEMQQDFLYLMAWIGAFSFFAFMTTLIREIIKDMEDFEGDSAYGRNTLPIVMGMKWSRVIVIVLSFLTIFALVFLFFRFLKDWLTFIYFVVFIILPLIYLMIHLIKSTKKRHYHIASTLTKFIMLSGILYALLANYIIHQNF